MERLTKKTFDKGTLEGHWFQELRSVYGATIAKKMYLKLKDYEDIDEKVGMEYPILIEALENGFWFKAECSFMKPEELERFKWKNSNLYDEEHNLIFCPGLTMDEANVIYPKASLSVMTLDGKKTYFLSMLNAAVLLRDYGKTWALTKEGLENNGFMSPDLT